MSVFNNILLGASAQGGVTPVHTIDQSIRFNNTGSNSTSHYFSRTPSSAGNQKTWTLSWWMKVGVGTDRRSLFSRRVGTAGAQAFRIRLLEDSLTNDAVIDFYMGNGSSADVQTFSYKFRDHSAWYHCVVTFDTTNAIIVDRLKFTVNGVRQTDTLAYANLDSDTNYVWNTANEHNIGRQVVENDNWMDGYMAEIVFIDGTAHDATDFGEYTSNGIWIPKNIHNQSFTFGTNGFYLTGQDASNLGYDYQTSNRSGTTNDWTSNNFNPHDQVSDSPTNNFAVLNPLNLNLTYPAQLSEGNLKMGVISGGFRPATSTIAMNSGKFYAEAISHDAHKNVSFGFRYADLPPNNVFAGNNTGQFGMLLTGQIYDESTIIGTVSGVSISGTQRVAIDLDAGKGWLGVDSDFFDSSAGTTGNPSTGANPTFTFTAGRDIFFLFVSYTNAGASTVNFGQDGTFAGDVTAGGNADANGIGNFKESVPSGYLALCTKNIGS
jgi:hypothetical protein